MRQRGMIRGGLVTPKMPSIEIIGLRWLVGRLAPCYPMKVYESRMSSDLLFVLNPTIDIGTL